MGISQGNNVLAYYKFKQTTKGYDVLKDGELVEKIELGKGELKSALARGVIVKEYIQGIIKEYRVDRCIAEGFAMDKKNSMVYNIGEFSGIVKSGCVELGYDVLEIPPNTLKKEATGYGMASKENMIYSLKKLFKVDVGDDDDCADALLLSLLF